MICFDANVIRRFGSREETSFTLMRGLARLTGHPLALPQTVLEELLGHYKRTIIEAREIVERNDQRRQLGKPARAGQAERLTQARDVLLRQVPWWTSRAEFFRGDNAALPLIDAVVEREEQRLRRLFTIVTKPAGADEEGNRREIDRRPPALHDGDSGKGSRDTAIWLSVLDAARQARPNLVFFVSNDGGFGSDGGRRVLRPELRWEADSGYASNLTFYFEMDQLVDRLSCPTQPPEPVETLINSTPILTAVRAYLSGGDVRIDLSGWRDELGRALETAPDDVAPVPRQDETRAARVGETTLVATNRIFHVKRRYGVPADGGGLSAERTAEFTVLLSLLITYMDGAVERVEVLSRGGLYGQSGL